MNDKIYTSPAGTLVWPRLEEPDTKFKEEGEYSTKLAVDGPDAEKLVAHIDKLAAESLAEARSKAKTQKEARAFSTKYLPYEAEETDDGELTGRIVFKFAMRASGTSRKTGKPWARKPARYDAAGTPLSSDIKVWGGSVGKVAFTFAKYAMSPQTGASVSLRLEAVQILELVSGGERAAEQYGFAEEEGYTQPAATEVEADVADDDGCGNADF